MSYGSHIVNISETNRFKHTYHVNCQTLIPYLLLLMIDQWYYREIVWI